MITNNIASNKGDKAEKAVDFTLTYHTYFYYIFQTDHICAF